MIDLPVYHCITQGIALPKIADLSPFRAVVVVEGEVLPEWQWLVSHWLVRSGCLYMMAWGTHCSTWDDSVDMANMEIFKFGEIPEHRFVMTTWHENEPLQEVFWFSKNSAFYPTVELKNTVLLHISVQNKERKLLTVYAKS